MLNIPTTSFKRFTGRYVLEGKLRGHTDAINCLTLSKNGQVLASGGTQLAFMYRKIYKPSVI